MVGELRSASSLRILILGGTKDAREIASLLVAKGLDVTTSLAGVTQVPILPEGKVRTGGYGGADGLRTFLIETKIAVLIDATHPYAAQISGNAAVAADGLDILHLRLERPAWRQRDGDRWIDASSISDAALALPTHACVMLTVGRKGIAPFLSRADLHGIIRMIEQPLDHIPPQWSVVQDRPPFSVESEIQTMREKVITHLVTKNAGSIDTAAKLDAARELNIPVVMVRRPQKTGGIVFHDVTDVAQHFARIGVLL